MFSCRVGFVCVRCHTEVSLPRESTAPSPANGTEHSILCPANRARKGPPPGQRLHRRNSLGLAGLRGHKFPPWRLRNHTFDKFCATLSVFIFEKANLPEILVALATMCVNMVAKDTSFSRREIRKKRLLLPTIYPMEYHDARIASAVPEPKQQ